MSRLLYRLLAGLAALAVRSGRSKDLEIIVLRHQLAVLRRTMKPVVTDRDRSLLAAIAKALPRARRDGWIVTPDTLLRGHRRLIARAGQFTDTFDKIFRSEGINIAKTPPRTTVANCFIERWFATLRRELLDRTLVWNETKLRRLVTAYVEHYNNHRPHRSLDQQPPDTPAPARSRPGVTVTATTRCDGLIHEYRQAA